MDRSIIHTTEWLTFICINDGVRRFFDGLSEDEWRDFLVAARILDTSTQTGRPAAGRVVRVQGSKRRLFELKVTPPGRRGPHVRIIFARDGRRILCAGGFRKRAAAIPRGEVAQAEQAIAVWKRAADDRKRRP